MEFRASGKVRNAPGGRIWFTAGCYFTLAGRRWDPLIQEAGFALASKDTARAPPNQQTENSGQMDTIKHKSL